MTKTSLRESRLPSLGSPVSASKFDRAALRACSAEECFELTKSYLRRAGGNFFAACLCLHEAVSQLEKRKDKRINYYEAAGLTKERAAEMLRVAEHIGGCKSANVRTYSPTALVQLGNLKNVGAAIVEGNLNVSVADLRTLKKELPPETASLANKAKIINAVNVALKKKPTKPTKPAKCKGALPNRRSDSYKAEKTLVDASDELKALREILKSKSTKVVKPNSNQVSSMTTSITNIKKVLHFIEERWTNLRSNSA